MRNPIYRSYLVELPLSAAAYTAGQQVNFPDVTQLKNVYIFGAQAVGNEIVAFTPNGRLTNATSSYFVTLYKSDTNNQSIQNYPAKAFDPFYNGGFYLEIVPFKIDLTKSFVTLNTVIGGGNVSVLINFFYLFNTEFLKLKK